MKSYRFDLLDSLDSLSLHEEPRPSPQRGELLLRVRAVSLNYRDIALVEGTYLRPGRAALIPVSDAAAEVVAVGEEVEEFRVGDRVMGSFTPRWFGGPRLPGRAEGCYGNQLDGWLTEYKVVSQEAVVRLPDALSFEEGATLPCAAVTAWNALAGPRPIRAGDTVLTLGTGGVSLFAVQLARALGARVIATTSSPGKAECLKALGADAVVNYAEQSDWGAAVRELTDGRGVDRIVEVGGPATVGQSLKAIAFDQEIVLVGFLGQESPGIDYFDLMTSGARIRSVNVGDRPMLEAVAHVVACHAIAPIIDRVFPFEEAKGAFEHLQQARHIGKVVIRVGD
ncbi:zinc-dependent alcohol dehydrogenase family protein [Salinicola halophyticus]|uniref:zinc-dependent alcohol dehydrogenase family protein n=1 Tax=Salinicola halophyticus TaxID=1808881 RepID=UPI003F46CB14